MPSYFENAKSFQVGKMDIQNVEGNFTDYGREETYEEHVGQVVYEQTHAVGVVNGEGEFSGIINYGGKKKGGKKPKTRPNASRSQTAPPEASPAQARAEPKGHGYPSNRNRPGDGPICGPPRAELPNRAATYFTKADDFEVEAMGMRNVGGDYVDKRTSTVRRTHIQEKQYNQQHAVGVANDRGKFTGTLNYNEEGESEEEDSEDGDEYDSRDGRGEHPPPDNGRLDNTRYSDEEEPLIELHDPYQPSPPPPSNEGPRDSRQQQSHWESTYNGDGNRWGSRQQQHQPAATQRQQRGRQTPLAPLQERQEHERTYRSSPGPHEHHRYQSSPRPNNRQLQRGFSPRPKDDLRQETLLDEYDDRCAGIQTPPLTPGKHSWHRKPQGGSGTRGYGGTANASLKRAPPVHRDLGGLTVQMEKMSVKVPEAFYASPPLTGNQYRGDTPQYFSRQSS